VVLLGSGIAAAQDEGAAALAARSAIVVEGKVVKVHASDERLLAPSDSTAVISIRRMYSGSEIAGDLAGRTATVILSRPGSLKVGDEALFFGNPRFMGKTLTIADEGEIVGSNAAAAQSSLQAGIQARKDKPVVDRLATASLVFRGTVESIRPLEPGRNEVTSEGKTRGDVRKSEHDPEWQVASVKVATPIQKATAGQVVTVLFPASRDIVWYRAPKLKAGQDAIFITHVLSREEAAAYRESGLPSLLERQPDGVHAITDPNDVLPPSDEARVKALLSTRKEAQ
jgi:hypothetical protein